MTPDPSLRELIDLASRSPSGHNAQPWTIVQTEAQRLVLRYDPSRWLRMVDSANRELLLSFGALIETIRQAAPSIGYRIDLEILTDRAEDPDVAQLDLTTAPPISSNAPAVIRSRATTRTPFLPEELPARDVDALVGVDDTSLHFVPRESAQGRWVVDAIGDAFD